jgi:hypothetical protein
MVMLQRRPFGEPDDIREIPYGRLETYDMGDIRIGRSILQPGWRWSESIKPIARTELCEYHHIGLCVSGSARIRMREGALNSRFKLRSISVRRASISRAGASCWVGDVT